MTVNGATATFMNVAATFLAALTVRVVVVFAFLGDMPFVEDAKDYHDFAIALLDSGPYEAAYYWPPGTSFFLATVYWFFGTSLLVGRLAMIAVSTSCVAAAFVLAKELFQPTPARANRIEQLGPIATGWVAAIYPASIMLAGQAYSQHLIALALICIAIFWLRFIRTGSLYDAALVGLFLGFGTLVRPSLLSIIPALMVTVVWRARQVADAVPTATKCDRGQSDVARSQDRVPHRIRILAGSVIGFLLTCSVLVPVTLHNLNAGAGWSISTNNERNFFLGNNTYTPHYKTSHLAQRPLDEHPEEVQAYLRSLYAAEDRRRAMMREAIHYIAQHPMIFALRSLNRFRAFWGFDYLASREIQQHKNWGSAGLIALLAFEAGGYVSLMLLAIVGVPVLMSRTARASGSRDGVSGRRKLVPPFIAIRSGITLLLLVFFYQAPYLIAFSAGTYHFPVVWLLMPFAAAAILWVSRLPDSASAVRVPGMPTRWTWILIVLLLVTQIEYGYFALAYVD